MVVFIELLAKVDWQPCGMQFSSIEGSFTSAERLSFAMKYSLLKSLSRSHCVFLHRF